MNNTAAQLVEQLGDKSEIMIMSDIVYGLDFEYNQLKQENEGLKEALKGTTHCFDVDILTEFEEWLEERINYWKQQEEIWIKEGFMKFGGEANNKIIFKSCLDKLQELKEGNK